MYFHVTVLIVECRLLRVFNTLRNIINLRSITSTQLSPNTSYLALSQASRLTVFCFCFGQGKYSFPNIYTFLTEKAMAPHSSTLAWRIPWMEEPAVHGVTEGRTRLSDFTFTFHFHALEKEMATHSSVLAWRIPGMGEPGGLPSMGSHRVGHD